MAPFASNVTQTELFLGGQDPNDITPAPVKNARTGWLLRDLSTGALWQFRTPVGGGTAHWELFEEGGIIATSGGDIFINSTTGLDTNDGLTIDTPIRTIDELFRRYPLFYNGFFGVNWALGEYPWPVGGVFTPAMRTSLGVFQAWGGELLAISDVLTVTVGDGLGGSLEYTPDGADPGAYRGKLAHILSGESAGSIARIATNPTGELRFALPTFAAIDPGDTFEIVEPGTIITCNADEFEQIRFMGNSGERSQIGIFDIAFSGSFDAGSSSLLLERSSFVTQGQSVALRQQTRADTFGTGISLSGKQADDVIGGSFSVGRYSEFFGIVVASDTLVDVHTQSFASLDFYDGENSPIQSASGSTCYAGGIFEPGRVVEIAADSEFQLEGPVVAPVAAVAASSNGRVELNVVSLDGNVVAAGVSCSDRSQAWLVAVTGTITGEAGLRLIDGSSIFYDVDTDVAGTDEIDQDGVATTYAAVAATPRDGITDARGNTIARAPAP